MEREWSLLGLKIGFDFFQSNFFFILKKYKKYSII
nr:MAG TPA: hypothetical protein [Caudoviricetes sp.]